jgi:hypothetical protein
MSAMFVHRYLAEGRRLLWTKLFDPIAKNPKSGQISLSPLSTAILTYVGSASCNGMGAGIRLATSKP